MQLSSAYGHKFDQVDNIPALSLVAKSRLTGITVDAQYVTEVWIIREPFQTGEQLPVSKSGCEQAGHLIFAELADRST